jgi:hypothetical protein
VRFQRQWRRDTYVSQAAGLDVLLARARPRVCFFGHHHARIDAPSEVSGVRCIAWLSSNSSLRDATPREAPRIKQREGKKHGDAFDR